MNKLEVIKILEKERDELLEKIRSIELTILTFKQSVSVPTNGYTNTPEILNGTTHVDLKYKNYQNLSIRDKAITILKVENRFLHMREILEIAESLEPNIEKAVIKKQIPGAFYNIKHLDNSPIVTKVVDNMNINTFWGSKNWLDENGNIKAEYMYKSDQIRDSKKQTIDI